MNACIKERFTIWPFRMEKIESLPLVFKWELSIWFGWAIEYARQSGNRVFDCPIWMTIGRGKTRLSVFLNALGIQSFS